MDDLFGGSESQQTSTSRPKDFTPSQFKGLRGPFANVLEQALGEFDPSAFGEGVSETDVQRFQDLFSVPETANEQTLRAQLMADAGGASGRQGLLSDTLGGRFLPGQAGGNPFTDAAIRAAQRPTLEGLTETLDRTLPGRFTAAGQFVQPEGSSAFDRAAGVATRGAANAMSDIATNISFGAHEAERGRQQEAIGLGQQEVETTIQNLQAQALPRMIQQFGIEKGLEEFNTRVSSMLDILRTVAGVSAPNLGQVSESQGTSETKPNVVGTLLSPFSFSGSV